jgi:hypothetical protein
MSRDSNLQRRRSAEFGGRSLWFLKEGLLMGDVINDMMRGNEWKYSLNYVLAWVLTYYRAALLIIIV